MAADIYIDYEFGDHPGHVWIRRVTGGIAYENGNTSFSRKTRPENARFWPIMEAVNASVASMCGVRLDAVEYRPPVRPSDSSRRRSD